MEGHQRPRASAAASGEGAEEPRATSGNTFVTHERTTRDVTPAAERVRGTDRASSRTSTSVIGNGAGTTRSDHLISSSYQTEAVFFIGPRTPPAALTCSTCPPHRRDGPCRNPTPTKTPAKTGVGRRDQGWNPPRPQPTTETSEEGDLIPKEMATTTATPGQHRW